MVSCCKRSDNSKSSDKQIIQSSRNLHQMLSNIYRGNVDGYGKAVRREQVGAAPPHAPIFAFIRSSHRSPLRFHLPSLRSPENSGSSLVCQVGGRSSRVGDFSSGRKSRGAGLRRPQHRKIRSSHLSTRYASSLMHICMHVMHNLPGTS